MLLFLAVLAARVAPLPVSYQPWQIFRVAAQGLAKRVLHDSDTASYQRLAGLLSGVVLIAPTAVLYAVLRELSDWPQLLDAVLLYFCLDSSGLPQQLRPVITALDKGQLSLARQLLAPLVLRDTQQLSAVGVVKAALDMLILRFAAQWFAVLCCFWIFGGVTTLCLRLALVLHEQWNCKLPRYQWYGIWLRQVLVVVTTLPVLLFSALLALQVGWGASMRVYRQVTDGSWPLPQRWLLSVWAQTLQRQTGGPVMYQGRKFSRARIGPEQLPQPADLALGLKYIATQQTALYVLGFAVALLHFT